MGKTIQHVIATTLVLAGGAAAAFAVFAWSGLYNFAADDPHTALVRSTLETLRERSIETRAAKLTVPDLSDPARVVQGAGNYAAMCAGCHLAPGVQRTEFSDGLYPRPPNLTQEKVQPGRAFWVIKHGIKASGMPAWGKSVDDESIWNLAAFLQKLPQLDDAQYHRLVGQSGGHSHGGGEMHGHSHGDAQAPGTGTPHGHGQEEEATAAAPHGENETQGKTATHTHADGKQHVHGRSPPGAVAAPPGAHKGTHSE